VVTLWELLSLLLVVDAPFVAVVDGLHRGVGPVEGTIEVLVAALAGLVAWFGLEKAGAAVVRRGEAWRHANVALGALYVLKFASILGAPAGAMLLTRRLALLASLR
jgi:hypothetical protein